MNIQVDVPTDVPKRDKSAAVFCFQLRLIFPQLRLVTSQFYVVVSKIDLKVIQLADSLLQSFWFSLCVVFMSLFWRILQSLRLGVPMLVCMLCSR